MPDSTELNILRQAIDADLQSGHISSAHTSLKELWQKDPTAATAAFVSARIDKVAAHGSLPRWSVVVLRSFTVEPLIPLIRAMGFSAGLDLAVRLGDFNTYQQEIINPQSTLYSSATDLAILAVQAKDLTPALWTSFADLDPAEITAEIDRVTSLYDQLIAQFRSRSNAHLIVHNLELPSQNSGGIFDAQKSELSQHAAFEQINQRLLATIQNFKNAYLLDYNQLVARRGAERFEDVRKWLTVRLPILAGELTYVAREWMKFIHPISGKTCKCLVTDLDNTLWGGVIGEDGMDGIKLDSTHRGYAWQSLQRVMLDFYRRGIILAIASKNNLADAREVIEKHSGMLLRPEHFAAMKINWNDKATSLREIAAELNIGIDSLAFIDDNPVEREWISSQLPEVTVINLPEDPMLYAQMLRDYPQFERLTLTDEDRERGRMYAEQRIRTELRSSAASLEDFYRSLEMVVAIGPATPATLARTAQLTQKTNQFNLTTRRYSEQQISTFLADPNRRVYTITVKDRMGDNGLVGVAIAHDQQGQTEIDTFLLSCRVIGRTVETAFLAKLVADAKSRGNSKVFGWYLPTKKNPPCRDFYREHHFTPVEETSSGTKWELDLSKAKVELPVWITMING